MPSAARFGWAPVMALNAAPVKIGIAAASAALPAAPSRMSRAMGELRRVWEVIQRHGPRGSVV